MTKAEYKAMDGNIKELIRVDREGWACGIYVAGHIFVGSIYDIAHASWYKDTPENRQKAQEVWKCSSFAREVKK